MFFCLLIFVFVIHVCEYMFSNLIDKYYIISFLNIIFVKIASDKCFFFQDPPKCCCGFQGVSRGSGLPYFLRIALQALLLLSLMESVPSAVECSLHKKPCCLAKELCFVLTLIFHHLCMRMLCFYSVYWVSNCVSCAEQGFGKIV